MKRLLIFFFSSLLFSANLNLLLKKVEKKEDLSNFTRQQSGGISYVITRYQLNMMQAHYLRDILRNTLLGYMVSRFNYLDPISSPFMPYTSVGIRIYIDNQEIGSAKFDNGLYLFGNINLDFVDHIEIYYMTPNYKDCIEPSFVIIKLYSRCPKRDKGNKLSFLHSTTKSNSLMYQNGYYDNKFNWKNLFHISKTNKNHPEYKINNKYISRDEHNIHFLDVITSLDKKHQILLNVIEKKLNNFMGISLDGAPDVSKSVINEVHFGYKYSGVWTFKYNFDFVKNHTTFEENPTPLFIDNYDNNSIPVYTINEKDYGIMNTISINKYFKFNKLYGWIGVDGRDKIFYYPIVQENNQNEDINTIKRQRIFSFFTENRYQINSKNIFSFAFKGAHYFNKNYKDYCLKNYKLGYIYVHNKNNIFKIYYYHYAYPVPLYLYRYMFTRNIGLEPQKGNALVLKYKKIVNKNHNLQFLYFIGNTKNYPYFLYDKTVYHSYIFLKIMDVRYKYIYNFINNFIIEASRMLLSHDSSLGTYDKISLLNTHRYGKFELFENLIFRKTKYKKYTETIKNLNLGIKYNFNDNLIFSLKGENLFGKGYTSHYWVYNYQTNTFSTYNIQLEEKKLIFGVEYLF